MFSEFNMSHLVPSPKDFDLPKGGLFGLFGKDEKRTIKKPAAKKPAKGKKEEVQALPEKEIICPYCKTKNKFPKGAASRYCGKCGKAYFR